MVLQILAYLLLTFDYMVIAQDILLKLMFYQHIPYSEPLLSLMKWRLDTYQDMWLDPFVIGVNALFLLIVLISYKPTKP